MTNLTPAQTRTLTNIHTNGSIAQAFAGGRWQNVTARGTSSATLAKLVDLGLAVVSLNERNTMQTWTLTTAGTSAAIAVCS